MSKCYTKLFSLKEYLFTENLPVIISSGELLMDNENGNVLVQLKFKNITNKTIIALKVKVDIFDVFANKIEGSDEYQYLDLSAKYNDEFGENIFILLPENVARSFSCEVTRVFFSNNTMWKAIGQKTDIKRIL